MAVDKAPWQWTLLEDSVRRDSAESLVAAIWGEIGRWEGRLLRESALQQIRECVRALVRTWVQQWGIPGPRVSFVLDGAHVAVLVPDWILAYVKPCVAD